MRIPQELRPRLVLRRENQGRWGLSQVYNEALESTTDAAALLFVHDDVYLHDWFIVQRVMEAISVYDVVGIAGSVNPDLRQPSWGLAFDANLRPTGWQPALKRSGAVGHSDSADPDLSVYGDIPQTCQLLDGVLLAVNAQVVRATGVRFDETFRFHLYDLDFCRSATKAGLTLGTWPISVTHKSRGNFDNDEFRDAATRYLSKWDTSPASG